jgi:hypothetical protein
MRFGYRDVERWRRNSAKPQGFRGRQVGRLVTVPPWVECLDNRWGDQARQIIWSNVGTPINQ